MVQCIKLQVLKVFIFKPRYFPRQHLIFLETNISRLLQLAALAQVRRLDQLTIHPEGNPVVSLSLWRSFVIYRLHHFNLQRINGQEVNPSH